MCPRSYRSVDKCQPSPPSGPTCTARFRSYEAKSDFFQTGAGASPETRHSLKRAPPVR
ncbi:hypothetical protein E0E52_02195 [Azotobacter chroococcum]|nr:hypothetical protein E0E52_02195 [Azotobacter chroococcum]